MIENIIKGKLNKLASEICLHEQKFVKNPDLSIAKLIKEVEGKIGGTIKKTWNKGLTKETDKRVMEYSIKYTGEGNPFSGKIHPKNIIAIFCDLDFYTSTKSFLNQMSKLKQYLCPRVYFYFDDILKIFFV
mgnify:CR=1 FL=1